MFLPCIIHTRTIMELGSHSCRGWVRIRIIHLTHPLRKQKSFSNWGARHLFPHKSTETLHPGGESFQMRNDIKSSCSTLSLNASLSNGATCFLLAASSSCAHANLSLPPSKQPLFHCCSFKCSVAMSLNVRTAALPLSFKPHTRSCL